MRLISVTDKVTDGALDPPGINVNVLYLLCVAFAFTPAKGFLATLAMRTGNVSWSNPLGQNKISQIILYLKQILRSSKDPPLKYLKITKIYKKTKFYGNPSIVFQWTFHSEPKKRHLL